MNSQPSNFRPEEFRALQAVQTPENRPHRPPPPVVSCLNFAPPVPGDRAELIRHRYLSRGCGLVFVAPTGVGKSTLIAAMCIHFALGREYCGFKPNGPLKILCIQAENDDGDNAEMIAGAKYGLEQHGALSDEEMELLGKNLSFAHECERMGPNFCNEVLETLLEAGSYDLIVLDPFFSYMGGDMRSQQDVGSFLRGLVTPLLKKHSCGLLLIHHTNKPPTGRDTPNTDTAYDGSGSADIANWARATLSMKPLGQGVVELHARKRGERLRWKTAGGERTLRKIFRQRVEGNFYWWEEGGEEDRPAPPLKPNGKPLPTEADILKHVPDSGTVSKASVIYKASLAGFAREPIKRLITAMLASDKLVLSKESEAGKRGGPKTEHLAKGLNVLTGGDSDEL